MESNNQQENTSSSVTPALTREEIIKQYLEKDLPGSKATFCRFYRRGCCLFSAKDCKYAHGVKDLKFNKLDYEEFIKQGKTSETSDSKGKGKDKDEEDNEEEGYVEKKNGKQPSIGLELSYTGLYDYQFILKERGEDIKIYPVEDINLDGVLRRKLRLKLQIEIQQEFMDFLLAEYNTKALRKSFIEKCFFSVDWIAHWRYIYSNFYGYEVKSMITKQLQGEAFDEFMENCIVKIIKDKDLLQKLPISPATVTKLYYQYIGPTDPLMPSHQVYLKYRDIKTMDDYLGSLQNSDKFLTKLANACGKEVDDLFGMKLFDHVSNEMQTLVDQIKAILIEIVQRSNIGVVLYARFEDRVMKECVQGLKQFNNNLPQIKKLMTKMVLQEKMLLVNLGSDLYIFSPAKFKNAKVNEIKEKYCEKLFSACSLPASDHLAQDEFPALREEYLNKEVPHRQTEEFLKEELDWNKIVVVDSEETIQAAREHLANLDAIGVDLEGKLERNGRLWLVQVSSKEKIFVFDVYKVKKMAKEDEKYVKLYKDMATLLKELAEDSKICKIFHDGRKDSLGFHVFLDACPANVFDLSAVYMMNEHLERYRTQKINVKEDKSESTEIKGDKSEEEKEKTSKNGTTGKIASLSGEIFSNVEEVKLPGLNEVLETYKASHGLNRLKTVMKGRFHYMPREYFMQRPMDKEFLIYSAKDVEDLIEIKDKMERRLKEILISFTGDVEDERVDLLCKKVSKTYALHGCEHKD